MHGMRIEMLDLSGECEVGRTGLEWNEVRCTSPDIQGASKCLFECL